MVADVINNNVTICQDCEMYFNFNCENSTGTFKLFPWKLTN